MRRAEVYRNGILAGELTQVSGSEYIFTYNKSYLADSSTLPISLTMPKRELEYRSDHLFPFFFNMLAEGVNRKLQSRFLKIDEHDYFGLLMETARYDTAGAITVNPIDQR
jgi:serine/threonine-protein kinase HipA